MADIEKLMLKKIIVKMKKFDIKELQRLMKILHLGIEWDDIMDKVLECRMRPTVSNIVSVINQYLEDSESIEETYHRVLLVDAIFHKSGYWWTVTVDKVNRRLLDKEIIRNRVQTMLDRLKIQAIAYVMQCNQLFWVLINVTCDNSENVQRNTVKVKLSTPCFFTIAPGQVFHVFHRPQNVDERLLKMVIKSIGANKCKPYALSGKHLQSMVSLLADKENKENKQDSDEDVPTKEGDDIRSYVNRLFGNKCRVLNQFTMNVESELSLFDNVAENKVYKSQIQLNSDSVIEGVKDMMLSGVLQPPYPSWATKLPVMGKNHVDINVHV